MYRSRSQPGQAKSSQGFTLAELVVVLTLTGIVAAVASVFLIQPVEGYLALGKRAKLVGQAETALYKLETDIHRALPNSVRVNGGALEMLALADGARYRDGPGAPASSNGPFTRLEFNKADQEFNLLGNFVSLPNGSYPNYYISIYNTGQPGADAYSAAGSTGVLAGPGFSVSTDVASESHITLNSAYQFSYQSPNKRLYVVSQAVGYLCSSGTVTRYNGYNFRDGMAPSQARFTDGNTGAGLLVDNVSSCQFSYSAGTATRGGVVTIALGLTSGGETVTLLHQVHVENAP
ncbi:MAG: type II secretion system protein [Gammaproteobacteria bacterium]|jgi:MSHA biogenesis protein MshO